MPFRGTLAGACFLALCACPWLDGQATGSISGTVTDSAGGSAAGAKVTLTVPALGLSREAVTDNNGRYLFPLLAVANFNIRVELKGFQPAEAKDIRLQVDEHRELDFKLAPASVSTTARQRAAARSAIRG